VVKLSTIEVAGSEGFRELFAVPFVSLGAKGRSSLGDPGEKEGNEVNDLSDIELAELDMYEAYLRGLIRTVCDRELFPEAFE